MCLKLNLISIYQTYLNIAIFIMQPTVSPLTQKLGGYASVRQGFRDQNQLAIFIRKNFTIRKNIVANDIKNLKFVIQQMPIVTINAIDIHFFQGLYDFILTPTKYAKRLLKNQQLKQLYDIMTSKIQIFTEIVDQFFIAIEEKLKKYNLSSNLMNQVRALKQYQSEFCQNYFFYYVKRFLKYYEKNVNKKQKQKASQTKMNKNRTHSDIYLKNYIKQQIHKILKQASAQKQRQQIINDTNFYLYPKILYKQFIQKMIFHFQQLLNKVNKLLQNQNSHIDNINTSLIEGRLFRLQHLQVDDVVCVNCLNCVQSLYQYLPVQMERNSLVDYEIISSVWTIKDRPLKILQTVTAFLNSGGGTLLFDCKQTLFGFEPYGQRIKLQEQQALKISFQNLLKYIEPKTRQKQISYQIAFLPLKQYPLTRNSGYLTKGNYKAPYIKRSYMTDLFVMRVKISCKVAGLFFACQIDKKDFFYIRQYDQNKQVKSEDIYEAMKKLSLRYFQLQNPLNAYNLNRQNRSLIAQIIKGRRFLLQNIHQGRCKQPIVLSSQNLRH